MSPAGLRTSWRSFADVDVLPVGGDSSTSGPPRCPATGVANCETRRSATVHTQLVSERPTAEWVLHMPTAGSYAPGQASSFGQLKLGVRVGIPNIAPYPLPALADLPPNVARWSVDPTRAALLVHDMQRYFLQPFAEDMAQQLVANTASLKRRSRALGMPVAYSMQPGDMTPQERGLLADFWGSGMRAQPAERDVTEALAPGPDDEVFTKWRYSAFFRTDLLRWLRRHGRDQLLICGVYGHVGVLATALEAFTHDVKPFLVADAIADFSADHHRLCMDYAAQNCAVVTITEEVLP